MKMINLKISKIINYVMYCKNMLSTYTYERFKVSVFIHSRLLEFKQLDASTNST